MSIAKSNRGPKRGNNVTVNAMFPCPFSFFNPPMALKPPTTQMNRTICFSHWPPLVNYRILISSSNLKTDVKSSNKADTCTVAMKQHGKGPPRRCPAECKAKFTADCTEETCFKDGRRLSVGTQNLLIAAPFTPMAFWGWVPGNFSAAWAIWMACAWLVVSSCWGPNQARVHSKRVPKIFGLSRHEASKAEARIWRLRARRWEINPTAANSLLHLFSFSPNNLTSAFHSLELAVQVFALLQNQLRSSKKTRNIDLPHCLWLNFFWFDTGPPTADPRNQKVELGPPGGGN